jgi:transposase-like protein
MPKKRYTPEEIIIHLRTVEIEQAKGTPLDEAARKVGVTSQTITRWKAEFGGLRVDQAKRLRELEQENQRLKKVVANLSLDNLILKEVSQGNF